MKRFREVSRSRTSDRTAIASLFAMLTFSPCEAFLPIYVTGIRFGWSGFILLTLILSVATVAGMLFFTWLTLAGIRNVRLGWFEQHESGVMGTLLLVAGLLVMFLEK
jgi:nickel/cobalt transporter (NicO) family protein